MLAMSGQLMSIIPEHIYGDGQDPKTHPRNNENVVGSGPFKLVEYKSGEHVILERYDDFFIEGRPYLDRIVMRIIPDPAARAIALEPRVVIADEATSALDGSIRAQILDLLLALRDELGLSMIFIAHDLGVVRYFCDRVAVMNKGRIVETGTARQICDTPQDPYTQRLISAVPYPDPLNRKLMPPVAAE